VWFSLTERMLLRICKGTVADEQVTGARVKLVNSAGAVTREAKSNEQGDFILDGVEPGARCAKVDGG
jgi:hypothetical protein